LATGTITDLLVPVAFLCNEPCFVPQAKGAFFCRLPMKTGWVFCSADCIIDEWLLRSRESSSSIFRIILNVSTYIGIFYYINYIFLNVYQKQLQLLPLATIIAKTQIASS